MTDHDHALRADEGLLAQKAGGGGDLVRRDPAGLGVIGLVAAALIFEISSAPCAPRAGCAAATFTPSAATRASAKTRFGGCMNGPDTAEGGCTCEVTSRIPPANQIQRIFP